jgi:DNA/RNA-binding domain of Phe-tRNA-synthetase-like protein
MVHPCTAPSRDSLRFVPTWEMFVNGSSMRFGHSPRIWDAYPQLTAGALVVVEGITATASIDDAAWPFYERASARIATASVSELPEIQAWRRAFAQMGLKPTQYRCASEALLRRFAKEGSLPSVHPLVDLCNAVSLAYAIPIAVFDLAKVAGDLEVRHADGTESYLTFANETEHPAEGEVIFADAADHAHARRWTNRQSALSAVRPSTTRVLIVAEALHATASADVAALTGDLAEQLGAVWAAPSVVAALTAEDPLLALGASERSSTRQEGPWTSG